MKRTMNGSIGLRSFTLEEDAWSELTNYLERLRRLYSSQPDGEEIVNDIEGRLGEHLWEWKGAQGFVITLDDVRRVERVMGQPEDLGSECCPPPQRMSRKLYRDPLNRVFGGVCSGLAYYFRGDVVLVRIVAVLLLFLFFSSFWVYLVLWIVLPAARTRVERLEMMGLPITNENLKQNL